MGHVRDWLVAGALIERGDWRRFYDPAAGLMYHGWWVQPAGPSRYHYGVLYAESRLGSVLAIGLGAAPPSHWFWKVRLTWLEPVPTCANARTE